MPNVTEYLQEATDPTWQATVREWLANSVCEFTFHKLNGEVRVLKGTLRPDILGETKDPYEPSKDVLVLWDTEKNAWRAMRWDRMMNSKIMPALDR